MQLLLRNCHKNRVNYSVLVLFLLNYLVSKLCIIKNGLAFSILVISLCAV